MFDDAEVIEVLTWMRRHFTEHGESPTVEAARREFPDFDIPLAPDALTYYVDKLRTQVRYGLLTRAISESAAMLGAGIDDIDDAQSVLTNLVADLNAGSLATLTDHDLTDPDEFEKMFDFYADLTLNPNTLRGWSTGYPSIDRATMGIQPKQLVTLVGPPKSGKTTILMSIADAIVKAGGKVVLVSFEMGYEELQARWVGMRCGLNYRRLIKGKMNDADERRMEKELAELQKWKEKGTNVPFIISEDIANTTTVAGLVAKVKQHKPDVLLVDGVYMMDDENGEPKGSSFAITNITRSLKRTALSEGLPILITTQVLLSKMRGTTVTAGSIGYASSFGQDSDVVMATEVRINQWDDTEHYLKGLLSRQGPLFDTQIDFDWSTGNFTEIAPPSEDTKDDDEEDDNLTKDQRRAAAQ